MSELIKRLRLLQAWYLPAGPEPEEAMPSKYRAFKEAADRIVELERDLAAANARVDAVSDALDYLKGLTPQQYADLRKDAERLAWIEALANTWRDEKCYEYCFRTPRLSLRESIDAAIAAKEKPNG